MSVDHYENFPVASALLPRHLRTAVVALYHYARSADDLADEGDAAPAERLAALARYRQALDAIESGAAESADPVAIFGPLRSAVIAHNLPLEPLRRLLSAFEYDVTTQRHADFDALLRYCHCSANPVGELLLHLYGGLNPDNLAAANDICTGLQLANFCQDVALDLRKGRIYIPQSDLRRHGLEEDDLPGQRHSAAWRQLMAQQTGRARTHLLRGAPLALRLPGRPGWELRLIVCGGLRILERIAAAGYDVFHARPTLRRIDWLAVAGRALTYRNATRALPASP